MKIHIHASGDASVGIPDCDATVEIERYVITNDEEKQFVRETLQTAFEEIFGDDITVLYEDEWEQAIKKEEDCFPLPLPEKYTDAYLELMVNTYNRYKSPKLVVRKLSDWYILRTDDGVHVLDAPMISEGDIESITDRVYQILKENGLLEFME